MRRSRTACSRCVPRWRAPHAGRQVALARPPGRALYLRRKSVSERGRAGGRRGRWGGVGSSRQVARTGLAHQVHTASAEAEIIHRTVEPRHAACGSARHASLQGTAARGSPGPVASWHGCTPARVRRPAPECPAGRPAPALSLAGRPALAMRLPLGRNLTERADARDGLVRTCAARLGVRSPRVRGCSTCYGLATRASTRRKGLPIGFASVLRHRAREPVRLRARWRTEEASQHMPRKQTMKERELQLEIEDLEERVAPSAIGNPVPAGATPQPSGGGRRQPAAERSRATATLTD